jgi:hypothetical protein
MSAVPGYVMVVVFCIERKQRIPGSALQREQRTESPATLVAPITFSYDLSATG